MKYKFLEHTADVKFQSYGNSLEEAFENAVYALAEVIKGKIKIKSKIKKKFTVKGKDSESLLYCFLEEFLFLLDSEGFLISKVEKLKIKDNKLSAEISGDRAENYKFSNNVKAITYNSMFVKESKNKCVCQVVLDV
ncbi:MAG: archease [Nanoarchaeota archaeon]|nr:archease [Nanoarchaeota archaeon]